MYIYIHTGIYTYIHTHRGWIHTASVVKPSCMHGYNNNIRKPNNNIQKPNMQPIPYRFECRAGTYSLAEASSCISVSVIGFVCMGLGM